MSVFGDTNNKGQAWDGDEAQRLPNLLTDFLSATVAMNGSLTTRGYDNFTVNENNGTDVEHLYDMMHEPWFKGVFIVLYTVIFLLGVSGNLLVVYVVLRNKSMQTITNLFITNLAISDIMMCLLAVPFTPLSAFLKSWVFGDVLCHIVPMTLGVSVYVSTLTSTAIAIDRYFVIVHPFKPRMKIFVCLLLIVAIWIISISISLPLAIYQKVSWVEQEQAYVCYEHWPKPTARQFFTVTNLILQYIVPCSIITFCYTKVSIVLLLRAKAKIGSGMKNRERDEAEIKRKKRTNKMLIAMVSIFVCCWLPLNTVHIISEYKKEFDKGMYFVLIFFVAHVIAMSSTIYNPFLYAWMNENFKKEFRTVVPFMFSRRHHSSVNGLTTQYTTVDTHSVMQRSPPHGNGSNCVKEPKATYEADSEKVLLQVAEPDGEC